ncbi:MAG TPA: hypothetical protein VFT74_02825 [Isosphaeraceae bacterium]|nr:hypothetical protein [Isosphaeraceae bacterium]
MPRIVEQATQPPGQCLFSQDIQGPFIDTEVGLPWHGPYGYISVAYIEAIAQDLLGMVPRREVEALEERMTALGEELDRLNELHDLESKRAELMEGAGI